MNELFDSLNTHEAEIKSEAFYIILNLYAYAGRCAITWADEIAKKLNFFGIPYELAETKQKGHATQLAEEASEKYKVIVAAGGDGTINEVVNERSGQWIIKKQPWQKLRCCFRSDSGRSWKRFCEESEHKKHR